MFATSHLPSSSTCAAPRGTRSSPSSRSSRSTSPTRCTRPTSSSRTTSGRSRGRVLGVKSTNLRYEKKQRLTNFNRNLKLRENFSKKVLHLFFKRSDFPFLYSIFDTPCYQPLLAGFFFFSEEEQATTNDIISPIS